MVARRDLAFVNVPGLVVPLTTAGRGCLVVLLRRAYLGLTNTLAMLRLLPMSDRAKDAEIPALRHQIMILERQLGDTKARFTPADRALLAALLHRLPAPHCAGPGYWYAPKPCCARTAI
jgi:hypothetical protein